MNSRPQITVVICTRNRAASLFETLQSLQQTIRENLQIEIVVVDNMSDDNTAEVIDSFAEKLSITRLTEKRQGKSYCLNRAVNEGHLGDIVAFLDDDITVAENWFQSVAASVEQHPDFQIFGGRVHLLFPTDNVPSWVMRGGIRWWALSGVDRGEEDIEMAPWEWPCGGHFWVRSIVFSGGERFDHLWATEPEFVLRLRNLGHRSMWVGRAVVTHRVQSHLLDYKNLRRRAVRLGRDLPHVRRHLSGTDLASRIRAKSTLLWLMLCAGNWCRHAIRYLLSCALCAQDARIERRLVSVMAMAKNLECLRLGLGLDRSSRWS